MFASELSVTRVQRRYTAPSFQQLMNKQNNHLFTNITNSLLVVLWASSYFGTVKPVLSHHSKEDKKMVFKTDYPLMQV